MEGSGRFLYIETRIESGSEMIFLVFRNDTVCISFCFRKNILENVWFFRI